MAWDRGFTGGSYTGSWHGVLDYSVTGQNTGGNYSTISMTLYTYTTSGSQNGTWDARIGLNGGEVAQRTLSANISGSGWSYLHSWSGTVNHDVNGNCYVTVGDYINAPVNDMNWGYTGWTLPRIPLAPGFGSLTATLIKPTSATISTPITSNGHGTSTTTTQYYRLQGSSTWISAGSGTTHNITGLKPGKTYEFYANGTNNNGDVAISATVTFKTKSVPGMVPVLMGLLR